jgi:TRAP-type C4-dicarboxylate transport system permease large subunit
MVALGAAANGMSVCLVGGANILGEGQDSPGPEIVESLNTILHGRGIVPVAMEYGVDPIHLGIIFLLNLEIGYMTPPLGLNLFLSHLRFEKPLPSVYRAVLPFFGLLLAVLLLVTYFPELSLLFTKASGAQ